MREELLESRDARQGAVVTQPGTSEFGPDTY